MSQQIASRASRLIESDYLLHVVSELCARPSVSGHERAVAEWTADHLRQLGLNLVVQEVLPGRPNVIATLDTGRPGPTLLFNGHLDTLPIPSGYGHDPFYSFVRHGRLYGAEINNMKGAVGAMIAAIAALVGEAQNLRGRIVLSAVMAECDSLGLGTLSMLESGFSADYAINGEPTDLQVMTCHVGVTQIHIGASGTGVHVCRQSEGRSALEELLPALLALDQSSLTFEPHPEFPGLPTINIGKVAGGTIASMLAESAEALIDVRTVPGMSPQSVLEDIEKAVGRTSTRRGTVPDVVVTLIDRPHFCQQFPYQVDPNETVVRAVAEAHAEEFGLEPYIGALFPQVYYGTDASHLSRGGIPTVIYGPGKVDEINVPNESMAIADLLAAARVYFAAACRLCAES